jgi:hypothetical protein
VIVFLEVSRVEHAWCVREGYLRCQKHIIVLVEQNAKLVFDVRGVDLHQHLGVC